MVKSKVRNIEYKPYGRIKVKLDDFMTKNNISTYALAKATGLEFKVVQNLREVTVKRVDFDVLAKVCYALEISVDEILEYEKQ